MFVSLLPQFQRLANLLCKLQAVSFLGCVTQMGLFIIFAYAECNLCLLPWPMTAIVPYATHTVLEHPMFRVCCLPLVAGYCHGEWVNMNFVTNPIPQLSLCRPSVLPHFFCDTVGIGFFRPLGHPDLGYWLQGTYPGYLHCGDPCLLHICHDNKSGNAISFQQTKRHKYKTWDNKLYRRKHRY